jgi:hypothetical protein
VFTDTCLEIADLLFDLSIVLSGKFWDEGREAVTILAMTALAQQRLGLARHRIARATLDRLRIIVLGKYGRSCEQYNHGQDSSNLYLPNCKMILRVKAIQRQQKKARDRSTNKSNALTRSL